MMQGIADEFISMAQKIIAQQIAMITFGTIMKILGIAAPSSSFKGDASLPQTSWGGGGGGVLGNISPGTDFMQAPGIASPDLGSGITPFAKGGAFTNSIVSSPTLMQFEDAGVMKTGVMGEAGDEAVMPLTRGPGGSLGVKAYLSDSRAALAGPSPSKDEEAFADNREALAATSAVSRERYVESVLTSGASSTEIKYSRVGSGDLPFVTEEDMLQATRLAAQEGAKLGERRTLAALRNNPAIRRLTGV
jgi:phage-related minor tail protein